jgi:uncharacterized membrane protein YkvI
METKEQTKRQSRFSLPAWIAIAVMSAVAVFFLWTEHRAHVMGALPYLLLLLCIGVHFFTHGGHGGHGGGSGTGHENHPGGNKP